MKKLSTCTTSSINAYALGVGAAQASGLAPHHLTKAAPIILAAEEELLKDLKRRQLDKDFLTRNVSKKDRS